MNISFYIKFLIFNLQLTRGIAQLNWKSDPYLCRIIKDIVKIHYKHLGPGAIAVRFY